MNDSPTDSILLRADPEHGGIRMAAILTMIFGLIGGYLLIRVLLEIFAQGSILLEFTTVLSCAGAVPIALLSAWLVEQYLKKTWSSGLEFELSGDEVHFEGGTTINGEADVRALDLGERINFTRWFFELDGYPKAGRERLVAKDWLCVACQMQQDDERIIVFTYAPPETAEGWVNKRALDDAYHQISLAALYSESGKRRIGPSTRPALPADWLTGPDGRYWIAERRRWQEGLELTATDYATMMAYIEQGLPAQE